jgi:Calcineurin-like phosphoesterase
MIYDMKIAILNDIHFGPALEFQGEERAASHLVCDDLPNVISHITTRHNPDLLINLGDLIRSESPELDLFRYQTALRTFRSATCPTLHLLGNHELKNLSPSQIETIWHEEGFVQKSYGSLDFPNLRLLWLGMESANSKTHFLPEEQLLWLEKTLSESSTPALLFTHCAIDDQNLRGNYFFETFNAKKREGFFLQNQEAIRAILSQHPILAVIQAHLHYFHAKTIDGITYVTCPAMADKICGPGSLPEVYTLITLEKDHLSIKAYSRDFCFAGTDIATSLKLNT